ncbi:hypothetical protein QBC32DRAFT_370612 [Pseudoneurospora amorphoporcata]|uniref:Uncharacterized protein n=1 Tax=Pseudoneurospora amorphoporcata TaxID=241081 RepID=A0AAN6NVY2_9PEZI|nr:hypothetical protein QBC32DRAFT_370612 [Pseudoneurospora amorphoporcata]
MGFRLLPSFRLFTFDTLSPLSRHTQTFAAHAPKAVLTSRDPALVPGRSNSFLTLLFGGSEPGLSDIHFFSSHEKLLAVLTAVLDTATHAWVIFLSGNQAGMIYRLRLACLTTQSFPLYYLTIYDTLYERTFGLLSHHELWQSLG